MKKSIGIGIIGTGFARRTQIPAFQDLENAKVVSVASGSFGNAESTAKEFGIEHFTDDWRETVTRKDLDLICITTPPDLHHEITLFALNHNKHILCEKPMAMDIGEALEMTQHAKEKGVLALIDHELRFTNGRMKAFKMIREGKIGKILHSKYHFCNSMRGDPNLPWTWWSDKTQGGGTLGAIGSHAIDTFRWFLDAEIAEVTCRMNTHTKLRLMKNSDKAREVTTDDEALMILKFGKSDLISNATAIVSLSMIEAGNYRNTVEFFGTKGALRIEDGGEVFFAETKEAKWTQVNFDLGKVADGMQIGGWSRGFVNLSEKIIEALLEEKADVENAATFDDGVQIQRVLDAARESDKLLKTISLQVQ